LNTLFTLSSLRTLDALDTLCYDRYLATPILQTLNPVLGVTKFASKVINKSPLGQSRKMSRAGTQLKAMPSMAERYFSIQSLAQREVLQNLLCSGVYEESIAIDFCDHFNQGIGFSKLNQLVRSDFAYYLPGDILAKVDIATMANSLELRSPMLDVNVVEWGVSLPDKFKIKGFETKHILKDVARSLVPADLIDRPKMGFGIPRAEWLRTGMKEMTIDTLTDNTASQRGWFNPIEVKKTIDIHMSGEDKDNQLWPMLMLELWARTWLD
jgi:asparagine synthase (glutamine-hydrolysing)